MNTLSISRFDPKEIAFRKTEEIMLHNMDIAGEILIASRAHLTYRETMGEVEDCYPSSRSIKSQLDNVEAIESYKKQFPDHFEKGVWLARNLPLFAEFVAECLLNKKMPKALSVKYKNAFVNDEWFEAFIGLIGYLLLEEQVEQGKCKSLHAYNELRSILSFKELQGNLGKIAGRIAKQNGVDTHVKNEISQIFYRFSKSATEKFKRDVKDASEEFKAFREYEPIYIEHIQKMRQLRLT